MPSSQLSNSKVWYLTHHGVYHKLKKKIRIVFNCSLANHGTSLNDVLYQGPDLTCNLLGVLLRFRQENVAFIGDIEKMFYMVKVTPKDRDYLRFFWFNTESLDEKPVQYRLTVHVFGAKSSPSVANFALRQTALDNCNCDEGAKAAVFRNYYVDDLLCSVSNVESAYKLLIAVRELVASGGFNLTGFVTNSPQLGALLPHSSRKMQNITDIGTAEIDYALGLVWNTEKDTISLKLNLENKPVTRRGMLSVIHSVYDPFGLTGPLLIPAKKIFQSTCKLQLGWDDEISENLSSSWKAWMKDLYLLNDYEIPRSFKSPSVSPIKIELHFFSDGSEAAYGSVVYVRFIGEDNFHCAPVIAKARLTPLNNTTYKTIPRIELNAAKLSIVLQQILKEELDYVVDEAYFWTDSTTVLKYINSNDSRFARFVANMISFIRSKSLASQWRYVPSSLNPADHISRGVTVPKFLQLDDWRRGPEFLWRTQDSWPDQKSVEYPKIETLEIKSESTKCLNIATLCDNLSPTQKLINTVIH